MTFKIEGFLFNFKENAIFLLDQNYLPRFIVNGFLKKCNFCQRLAMISPLKMARKQNYVTERSVDHSKIWCCWFFWLEISSSLILHVIFCLICFHGDWNLKIKNLNMTSKMIDYQNSKENWESETNLAF